MCIIVVKPEGTLLGYKQLLHMWSENPHGAGFMYAHENKLVVVKGLMKFKDLFHAIREHGMLRKMVIHFRWKTHGAASPEMTHPFWLVDDKLAMVHNGVIGAVTNETTNTESDTAVFAKKLKEGYSDVLVAVQHPFHRQLIEKYIGHGNKLVFMDSTGETHIINETAGTWKDEVWYSNNGFEKKKIRVTSMKDLVAEAFWQRSKEFVAQEKNSKKEKRREKSKSEGKQQSLIGTRLSSKEWWEYEDEKTGDFVKVPERH